MEEIKIRSLRDKQKNNLKNEDFFQSKVLDDLKLMPDGPKKKRKNIAAGMAKFMVSMIFVFVIGGLGGIWLDRIFIPTLLVKYPELSQYEYIKNVSERTTIVHETREVKISEEEAISDVIEKMSPAVVEVLEKNASGQEEMTGSGIILTSDGYIITPLQNIFARTGNANTVSQDTQIRLKNDKTYSARLVAQDANYSLAILKIDENNLSVIPYANAEDLKLGQKVIILNDTVGTDIISKFIDNYIMPNSTDSSFQKRIQISQKLAATSAGSAVIGVDGKLIGVEQGENIVIPLSEMKGFIEKSIAK